ncbi:hypothetical protein ABH924_000109 [Arthrobacter sp. GAS37]
MDYPLFKNRGRCIAYANHQEKDWLLTGPALPA